MNPKTSLAIAAGVGGVAMIGFLVSRGQQTTQGVVFKAPDPASVAAVTSASANEISTVNAATTARMKIVSDTLTALGLQSEQLQLGTLAAGTQNHQIDATTTQVGLQVSGQEYAANTSMQSAIATANANAAAAEASTAGQISMAQIYAGSATAIATAQANAQTAVAATAADAAKVTNLDTVNAQKSVANKNMWSSIGSSIANAAGSIFKGLGHL